MMFYEIGFSIKDRFEIPNGVYSKEACLITLSVGRLDQEMLPHPPSIITLLWLFR